MILLAINRKDGCLFSPCSKEKALEILRDDSVIGNLSGYPEDIDDVELYLMNDGALLVVMPHDDIAEVHIACTFRHRANLRANLESGLRWLKNRGFIGVITTAPNHRKGLTNMLSALGFIESSGVWIWA